MYNIRVKTPFIKSKLYLIPFLSFLAFFANVNYAYSGQTNLDNIPVIEPMKFMPDEDFEEKTKPITYESEVSKNLSYTLRLPADWKEAKAYGDITAEGSVLGKKVLGNISRFVSPPSPTESRNFFTVEAMKLTYEIGVQNWFINYVLINGLSLERMTLKNKKELEAIYVEVRKDTTYIVRVRAIINGSDMVVARYYATQESFKDEKVIQAQSLNSFNLTFPDASAIEELKTFGFLSQSYFDYPPSWTLKTPQINSIDRMKARLRHSIVKDKLNGQIDIKLMNKLSASSRSDIIKEFREGFSISKYSVKKFIESPEMEYHKDMSFGMAQTYELTSDIANMINYELWISVMEGEDYYYLISLVTPARGEDFYKWARNIETYKLVVKNMRRHDSSRKLFEFVK